ncbi:glycosyltransferase [Citrobacter freundii]|uniref:glycosyltransferase n=1 Tax=Citrobacter freundii TaxID=546 RepID=UPI003890CBC5
MLNKMVVLSDARNYGIQRSRGKYISFIDSDDIVNPEFINVVVSILIQNEFDVMSFEFKIFWHGHNGFRVIFLCTEKT